jgi:TonB family protein
MAQQRPHQQRVRSLRIGIILGGKIVEEKLIRKREQITIGQSAKNTFSVPIEGMPRQWPLFVVKDNRYFLHFSDAMDGRVSDGGGVHPLAALKSQGAQRHGEGWVLPLPESARGKIVLGDMTLLFQFVTAPPLQPRPHLPASVRGTLADRIDPHLAIITAISVAAHLFVMIYAGKCHDPPKKRVDVIFEETFPQQYKSFDQPKVVEVEVEGEGEGEGESDEGEQKDEKPTKKPSKDKGDDDGDNSGTKGPKSDEELQAEANAAVAQMFGRRTQAGETGTQMGDRDPKGDLSEEARRVEEGETRVAGLDERSETGPSRNKRERGSTGGPDTTGGGGPKDDPGGDKRPRVPEPVVKPTGASSDDRSKNLSPASILAKIRRQYSAGLKQCFRQVLKIDETAAGTIKLKFKISERGSVARAKVTSGFGFPTLDKCVEAKARTWRFDPPRDEDGDPRPMTVSLSLPFAGR